MGKELYYCIVQNQKKKKFINILKTSGYILASYGSYQFWIHMYLISPEGR